MVEGNANEPQDVIFLTIYVDDMLLLGEDKYVLPIQEALEKRFKVKQLGNIHYLLGIEIDYQPGKYLMFSQTRYIEDIIKKFGNANMNRVATPQVVTDKTLPRKVTDEFDESKYPYHNLIGCLQYLVTGSRCELANVVRVLSKNLMTYSESH